MLTVAFKNLIFERIRRLYFEKKDSYLRNERIKETGKAIQKYKEIKYFFVNYFLAL